MPERILSRILRILEQAHHDGPLDNHSAPRFVHLHPSDFDRLKALTPTAPADYAWRPVNALAGLDVLTNTGQPAGSHRITDQHGCLITDTRHGTRPLARSTP